uniref:Uncharacterized protein n=1 Tax=Vespula pensylvanica TaxID=30213 RepID=A0A834NSA1_VESPE|nr:hypothetical protein H0235_011528 [Vespula pensylvanica]
MDYGSSKDRAGFPEEFQDAFQRVSAMVMVIAIATAADVTFLSFLANFSSHLSRRIADIRVQFELAGFGEYGSFVVYRGAQDRLPSSPSVDSERRKANGTERTTTWQPDGC